MANNDRHDDRIKPWVPSDSGTSSGSSRISTPQAQQMHDVVSAPVVGQVDATDVTMVQSEQPTVPANTPGQQTSQHQFNEIIPQLTVALNRPQLRDKLAEIEQTVINLQNEFRALADLAIDSSIPSRLATIEQKMDEVVSSYKLESARCQNEGNKHALFNQAWEQADISLRLEFVRNLATGHPSEDLNALIEQAIQLNNAIANRDDFQKWVRVTPSIFSRLLYSLESSSLSAVDVPAQLFNEIRESVIVTTYRILEHIGVILIKPKENSPFGDDHKVMGVVPSMLPKDHIVRVRCYGVMLKGVLLLPAEVDVSSGIQSLSNLNSIPAEASIPPEVSSEQLDIPAQGSSENLGADFLAQAPQIIIGLHRYAMVSDNQYVRDEFNVIISLVQIALHGLTETENISLGELLTRFVTFFNDGRTVPAEWRVKLATAMPDIERWLCEKLNLQQFKPNTGDPFDASRMKAVETTSTFSEDRRNTVAIARRHGYLRGDDVLVLAEVKRYE